MFYLIQGTGYIYETLLRPFVIKHETDIDKNLQELRTRTWDLAIYYYHNCTELGQTKFFQVIEYLASQSKKIDKASSEVYIISETLLSHMLTLHTECVHTLQWFAFWYLYSYDSTK